jgi:hypothetical protein
MPITARSSQCFGGGGNTPGSPVSPISLSAFPPIAPELFVGFERAARKASELAGASRLIVAEKKNFATRMAALVIPTVGNNGLGHEALQRFILANDSTTLAVEVPI